MSEKSLRIALVGAGTLLGKALSDELAASAFASADLRLLDDDEEAQGKLAAPIATAYTGSIVGREIVPSGFLFRRYRCRQE